MQTLLFTRLRRDLAGHKFQIIILVVILGAGGGAWAGMLSSVEWRKISNERFYETNKLSDGVLEFVGPSFANESSLESQLANYPSIGEVEALDLRLKMTVGMQLDSSDGTDVVTSYLYGLRPAVIANPSIDVLEVREGRGLVSGDVGSPNIVVDYKYAEAHQLTHGKTVTLRLGTQSTTAKVVGLVTSPEWMFLINPDSTSFSLAGSFSVGYVPLPNLQNQLNMTGAINQLTYRVKNNLSPEFVGQNLQNYLYQLGYTTKLQLRTDMPAYSFPQEDIENDRQMMGTFAVLILLIALFAIWISINRLITNQRRIIGVDLSLGSSRRRILAYYLSYGTAVGLVGSVVAVALGLVIGKVLGSVLLDVYDNPLWVEPFLAEYYLQAVGVCLLVSLLSSFWPALKASNLLPLAALREDPSLTASVGRLSPIITGLMSPLTKYSINARMALRNILRNQRRTLATIIGVSLGVGLVLSMSGIFSSLSLTLDDYDAQLGRWDLRVTLYQPTNVSKLDSLLNHDAVDQFSYGISLVGSYQTDSGEKSLIQLNGFTKWGDEGSGSTLNQTNQSVIISEQYASGNNIAVGDTISVSHLSMSGGNNFILQNSTLTVAGYHQQVSKIDFHFSWDQIQLLTNAPNQPNQILLRIKTEDSTAVINDLYNVPFVQLVERRSDPVEDAQGMFDILREIMEVVEYFSIGLAIGVIVLTSIINRGEREREIGTMSTLGASDLSIIKNSLWEVFFLTTIGILAGFAFGFVILEVVLIPMMTDMFENYIVKTHLSYESFFWVGGGVLGLALLAQLPTLSWLRKLDLAQATKVRDF